MSEPSTQDTGTGALAKPTPAHRRFEPFAGAFAAEVRMWMGSGEPHVSTGTMINTLELNGLFLWQVYKGDSATGSFSGFEGRGFWGYNTITEEYEGFWIDNASSVMQVEHGDVDASGTVWTMMGKMTDPRTGQPFQKRSVITLVDQDHHRLEMFFTGPDGKDFKAMEITYRRR